MSMQDLKKAFELSDENFSRDQCHWGGEKSIDLIEAAENILGVKFPETYKTFIKERGFGGPRAALIPGIISDKVEDLTTTGVVWRNLKNRKDFSHPNHLIILYDVGEGTKYCLDTSQMNQSAECPVVVWPIFGYEATPVLEIEAEDFGKFFLNMVQEEIEDKNDDDPGYFS